MTLIDFNQDNLFFFSFKNVLPKVNNNIFRASRNKKKYVVTIVTGGIKGATLILCMTVESKKAHNVLVPLFSAITMNVDRRILTCSSHTHTKWSTCILHSE